MLVQKFCFLFTPCVCVLIVIQAPHILDLFNALSFSSTFKRVLCQVWYISASFSRLFVKLYEFCSFVVKRTDSCVIITLRRVIECPHESARFALFITRIVIAPHDLRLGGCAGVSASLFLNNTHRTDTSPVSEPPTGSRRVWHNKIISRLYHHFQTHSMFPMFLSLRMIVFLSKRLELSDVIRSLVVFIISSGKCAAVQHSFES